MNHVDNLRFMAFSTLALLLYSAGTTAGCIKPEWPDPISFKHSSPEATVVFRREFQSRIYEFIACARRSLEKRAAGLSPSGVRQLILRDRAAEDRALAELESVHWCFSVSRRESDPEIVRATCEGYIESALRDRRRSKWLAYTELTSEQRSAYGGVWSYRTLNFGRPGNCMDGPCDHMLGVEVTNMTPAVLTCEVVLKVSDRERGALRGEQVITLSYPRGIPSLSLLLMSTRFWSGDVVSRWLKLGGTISYGQAQVLDHRVDRDRRQGLCDRSIVVACAGLALLEPVIESMQQLRVAQRCFGTQGILRGPEIGRGHHLPIGRSRLPTAKG